MSLTQEDVKEILHLLEASHFNELHLETDGLKLSVRRGGAADHATAAPWAAGSAPPPEPPKQVAVSPAPPAAAPLQTPAPPTQNGSREVRAPLLGTFYRAPKPGAEPFVALGSKIAPETVIGIIEVMKLMTSVVAGVRGEVVEICANDAEMVEHGQVLIRVREQTT